MRGATIDLEMADSDLVVEHECLEHTSGPYECLKMETKMVCFTSEAWSRILPWQSGLARDKIGYKK